jgi:hypothetical protein
MRTPKKEKQYRGRRARGSDLRFSVASRQHPWRLKPELLVVKPLGLPVMSVCICSVRAGGPACRAGIQEGDELVAVEGVPVGKVAHWGQVYNIPCPWFCGCFCTLVPPLCDSLSKLHISFIGIRQ